MTEAAQSRRIRAIGSLLVGIAVVGVLLAGVLAALSVAAPASAHAALTASDPAEGATVSADLDRVTLTFTEAPLAGLDAGLRIEVRDAGGTDESTGDVDVSGTAMSKAVTLSAGPHTVLWRYVSPDGHPIDGQVAFTVTAAPAPSASSTVPSPGPSSAATPAASSVPTSTPAVAVGAPAPSGPFPWVLGAVLVALLGAAVAALALRLRRRAGRTATTTGPTTRD